DTERAVEILTRYQSTLQSPEEQELKASIGKVSHIFQSDLFQALLDIHEFYDFTLHSAPLQPPSPDTSPSTARQQHEGSQPSSTITPGEPQNLPENPSRDGEWKIPTGAGTSAPGTSPWLVRVTARRTETLASVCSLVLGSHSALPQVSL
ncbi:DLG1 protein, partial [Aegotheles bennettii]|nr:DLG1 protein [Aegotheles bennettii]